MKILIEIDITPYNNVIQIVTMLHRMVVSVLKCIIVFSMPEYTYVQDSYVDNGMKVNIQASKHDA